MSDISYIQIYNADQDPIFLEIYSSNPMWTLPKKNHVKLVSYVTHIAENEQYFYEKTSDGEVSWTLPSFCRSTQDMIKTILMSSRDDCEKRILHQNYDEAALVNQINLLDAYLDNKDEMIFEDDDYDAQVVAADDEQSDMDSRVSIRSTRITSLKKHGGVKNVIVKVRVILF
jgi:hypothetical protein